MMISKFKSAWAAIVRRFQKSLKDRSNVSYPSERIERFDPYRDDRFRRFF